MAEVEAVQPTPANPIVFPVRKKLSIAYIFEHASLRLEGAGKVVVRLYTVDEKHAGGLLKTAGEIATERAGLSIYWVEKFDNVVGGPKCNVGDTVAMPKHMAQALPNFGTDVYYVEAKDVTMHVAGENA